MRHINYPPEEICSPFNLKKPSYDHIILWMLANNDECQWSDFTQEPIKITIGTLSRHLDELKRKGFVEIFIKGHYRITLEGKKKFHELSSVKKVRKLNYPPKIILRSENYSHWILWMVYNNNFCMRSDFIKEPLSIDQNSLSKNLNLLVREFFIKEDYNKYRITQLGKLEYSKILQHYDLDRQTILEKKSRRIDKITEKNEFKVNEFLSVRLEDGITNIYVKDHSFMQCAFLLLNIPVNNISTFDEIKSIDEMIEELEELEELLHYLPGTSYEEKFWVQCSNLQVWAEMNYNTYILRSNIAFSLLKKLAEVGDPVAKGVFKEEIIKRFEKGRSQSTMVYLLNEEYLEYLDDEEFIDVIENNDDLLRNAPFIDGITPLRFWSLSSGNWGTGDVGTYILNILIKRKLINHDRVKKIFIELCNVSDETSHIGLNYDLGLWLTEGLVSGDIEKLDTEIIDLLLYNRKFIECARSYIRGNIDIHTKSLVKIYKQIIIRRLNQGDYKAIILLNTQFHKGLLDAERNVLFDAKDNMRYWKPDELFNLIYPILPELLKEGSVSGYRSNFSKRVFTISMLKELNKYGSFPEIEKILKNLKYNKKEI